MKQRFANVVASQFFKGSFIVLIATNTSNLSQFVFHFLTGRYLGKVLYGDLASIISLLGVIGIVQSAIGLTIIKSIAVEKGNKVANFIKWVDYYNLLFGCLVTALFLLGSPFIIRFLNISEPMTIYIIAPLVFLYVVTATGRSVLQGLLDFNQFALNLFVEAVLKVIFAILFLYIGWVIFGALGAMLISSLASYIILRNAISSYLKGKRGDRPSLKPLIKYTIPVFVQGLALTSMYTSDLILVKHFFAPEKAGIYASLAILGRIVFFGANPIVNVMFPIISKKHALNERYIKVFSLSLLLVLVIATIITTFFFFFPKLPIQLLYGESYLEGAPILWLFGIFMTLLAIAMLFTQFYLSVNRTRIIYVFPLASALQIILICLYHNGISQVINMSIISVALLDFILLVYFPYHRR